MRLLCIVAIFCLSLPACLHPVPNPGQVVISCTMDAVKDPKVLDAVMNALAQPNFEAALLGLIDPAIGVTAEVVACVLHSFLGKLGADPAKSQQYSRARTYLSHHGYETP